jgi:hypothetical protein
LSLVQVPSIQRIRGTAYFLAFLLIFLSVGEIVATAFPFHVSVPLWRFSIGAMAGVSSATILVGIFLALVVAAVDESRRALWIVCTVAALFGVAYLGLAGAFLLDALQIKGTTGSNDPARFKVSSAWVFMKLALSSVAFLLLSLTAGRATRSQSKEVRGKNQDPVSPLLVGRPRTTSATE